MTLDFIPKFMVVIFINPILFKVVITTLDQRDTGMKILSISILCLSLSIFNYAMAWTDLGINEFTSPNELTELSELSTGRSNNAIVDLNQSSNSKVVIRQHNFGGVGSNNARVTQTGTNNSAELAQLGGNNTGLIIQNGHNNSATLQQWGANHEGAILQEGNDNIAYLNQVGNGKENVISQTGDSNIAAAVNKSSGASFSIEQTGNQGIILVNGMDRFISIIN